jgi:hypothetical protein
MIEAVYGATAGASTAARRVAVRAVASSIVRTVDMHPNLAAVLREVIARSPEKTDEAELDDPRLFLARLRSLGDADRRFVVRVLAVASVIDGRLTRAERALYVEARAVCGLPPGVEAVEALRKAFLAGDALDRARIETL